MMAARAALGIAVLVNALFLPVAAQDGGGASDEAVPGYSFAPVDQLPETKGLQDPFRMADGSRVETLEDWQKQRRYLKAMLAHYQYGHMPPRPKNLEIEKSLEREVFDGKAVEERHQITLRRNGRSVTFRMALIRPGKKDRRPVVVKNCHDFFDPNNSLSGKPSQTAEYDRAAARLAVERGYILCKFIRTDLARDQKNNRDSGVFPLYPEYDWGTIAAWAWGHQVVVDALNELGHADMERIVATGHSRGGKTALCAGVYDERIAITAPNSSGTGGTGSMRYFEPGQRPQTIGHHIGRFDHWWVPRYLQFSGKESRLPFDAHFAKALIAPRGLINPHARQDYWANPYGTQLTYQAAQPVFDWLGAGDHNGIHWREGGHAQKEEDWRALFDFADRYFFGKDVKRRFDVLAYPDAEVPVSWKAPPPIPDPGSVKRGTKDGV